MPNDPTNATRGGPRFGVSTWIVLGFMAIAAFLWATEHRAHAFAWWLPHILLGACIVLLYLATRPTTSADGKDQP